MFLRCVNVYSYLCMYFPQTVPPPSLAGDLGGALGSMEHADVKFIAGGRPIYAHRAVLSCESEYFSAMFRFRCARTRACVCIAVVVVDSHNSISSFCHRDELMDTKTGANKCQKAKMKIISPTN